MASEIKHKMDRFNGIIIDVSQQILSLDEFTAKLVDAMSEWKQEGKRCVWVTVETGKARVIPQLTELGFDFHHAKPGCVCLTIWLPKDIPNHVPGYANQFLGAAGFVVNAQNQVLVVRERYHILNNITNWKLPGGLADAGEEIGEAAKREVFEETGIHSEYVCTIAYRHMHQYRHGCSDFYHVCLMKPLSTEIKACPQEIAECKWMDLDEYENLESISDINKYFVQRYRDILTTGYSIAARKVRSFDKKTMQTVYSVGKILLENEETPGSSATLENTEVLTAETDQAE